MAYPAQKYQTTPQPGNPARTEAWALLESARDLSHSKTGPADRFLAAASSTKAELLVGTRMNDVSEMPFVRRMVNRYMSNTISRLCGQPIPDSQCGFRMVHRNLIPDLLGGGNRFDYETEMLIIASRKGYWIESVPITTVYSDEVSSIHPVRDTLSFFKLMRRYRKL